MEKEIQRIILKEEDVLLVKIPRTYWQSHIINSIYKEIKKKLLPRKNKILMLPSDMNISVIGQEEIKEMVSTIDLWELFDNEDDMEEDENDRDLSE